VWETTLDPNIRTLLKVEIKDSDDHDRLFSELMGDRLMAGRLNASYARIRHNIWLPCAAYDSVHTASWEGDKTMQVHELDGVSRSFGIKVQGSFGNGD